MTFDIDSIAETSVTATVRENAAPFGATPERDGFDRRTVRDKKPVTPFAARVTRLSSA